ncbi:hypothetical protein BH09BAC4_BH09BAC4_44090 [soil metagenome]
MFIKYRLLHNTHYLSWNWLKRTVFTITKSYGQKYRIDFTSLQTKNTIRFNAARALILYLLLVNIYAAAAGGEGYGNAATVHGAFDPVFFGVAVKVV